MFKTLRHNQGGFTLIELSVVIAVLGILSGIGLLKLQDSNEAAKTAVVDNTAAEVQRFIQITAAQGGGIPQKLDDASGAASAANQFFTSIGYPVSKDWEKAGQSVYRTTNLRTNRTYIYDDVQGLFTLSSGHVGSGTTMLSAFGANNIQAFQGDGQSSGYNGWFYDSTSSGQDAVYNPWSGKALTYTVTFDTPGTYTIDFDATNYAALSEVGRDPNVWTKPDNYSQFNFTVGMTGQSNQTVTAKAEDGTYNSLNNKATFVIGEGQTGTKTISITWTNDSYNPTNSEDANAMIRNVRITKQ